MASQARGAALLPLLVLLAFGLVFGAASLGVSPPAFDDHPGQLYRLWHVVTHGPAPWAWNDGWWTGYPELQFYPPAFAYAGALLHAVTLGALSVPAAYHVLLWLAYLAPGVTAWIALAPRLASGWLALPGAFVALTLSLWPALASGVEGGVHVGMVPARLAWSALPLLARRAPALVPRRGAFPARAFVPLTAGIVLTHPAHLPAAVTLVVLVALSAPGRRARIVQALRWLVVAALVTSFWTVPLLARLADTRALAWGTLTPSALGEVVRSHPLVIVLVILGAGRHPRRAQRRRSRARLVAVGDRGRRRRRRARPGAARGALAAGRSRDGQLLARARACGRTRRRAPARTAARSPGRSSLPRWASAPRSSRSGSRWPGDGTLAVWAKPGAWPSYPPTERGLRLPALWAALRTAPAGRVLFVRSGVPLVYGRDWWRPHTHITALTPLRAGRAIVNGTFTHPSPVAALVYRGATQGGAITELVERLDGRSLFGQPLDSLDATTFNAVRPPTRRERRGRAWTRTGRPCARSPTIPSSPAAAWSPRSSCGRDRRSACRSQWDQVAGR